MFKKRLLDSLTQDADGKGGAGSEGGEGGEGGEKLIDIDELDKKLEGGEDNNDPDPDSVEGMKAALAKLEKQLLDEKNDKIRFKNSLDKSRSEIAKLSRAKKEEDEKSTLEQQELLELKTQLAKRDAADAKRDLTATLADDLQMSNKMVSSFTNAIFSDELDGKPDVGEIRNSLTELVKFIKEAYYEKGLKDGSAGTKPKGAASTSRTEADEYKDILLGKIRY